MAEWPRKVCQNDQGRVSKKDQRLRLRKEKVEKWRKMGLVGRYGNVRNPSKLFNVKNVEKSWKRKKRWKMTKKDQIWIFWRVNLLNLPGLQIKEWVLLKKNASPYENTLKEWVMFKKSVSWYWLIFRLEKGTFPELFFSNFFFRFFEILVKSP